MNWTSIQLKEVISLLHLKSFIRVPHRLFIYNIEFFKAHNTKNKYYYIFAPAICK